MSESLIPQIRQLLAESNDPNDEKDSETKDAFSKFLDMVKAILQNVSGKTSKLGKGMWKKTAIATGSALDDYTDLLSKSLPKLVASGVLKNVDKAVGFALEIPGKTIKRTLDALTGTQKLRAELLQVVVAAPTVSTDYANVLSKQIDRINSKVKDGEYTPGQAKKLLRTLIATAKRQIIQKEQNPTKDIQLRLQA